MAQTPLDTSPAAQYAILTTLTWSNLPTTGSASTVKRYTNWTSDLDINGDQSEIFLSIPNMEVEIGEVHGGTADKPGKMMVSRDVSPFDVLRSGLVHPSIDVLVEQLDPSDMLATRRTMFAGRLGKIHANPGGRTSLVRCALSGVKAPLKHLRVGFNMTPSCQNIFGDGTLCLYDKEATKAAGTVISVGQAPGGRTAVKLSLPAGARLNENYRRGTIFVGGMKLGIRKSLEDGGVGTDHTFEITRIPPAWLVGLDVELFEGCDKQYSTCERYLQTDRFVGLGIKIPSRHPVFEA